MRDRFSKVFNCYVDYWRIYGEEIKVCIDVWNYVNERLYVFDFCQKQAILSTENGVGDAKSYIV